ncbi:glycosyltransferase family 2 protein [Vibrio cyclitrophicus]|nr:glycosyltransferase family A protein [Vibrio cyclitrophicus]UPR52364.1 glycosyltransferase family 2 protein [Vibrio cyclitrophicus]
MMNSPVFSVFTPTFNRRHLINRVYESLCAQTFKDFEWIIIDDGSVDDTESLVNQYISEGSLNIKYKKIENGGKVNAVNLGLDMASGFFFLVFDSDDWCTSNALDSFYQHWSKLDNPNDYCAISCLKSYQDGCVVGEKYTDYLGSLDSYVDRFNVSLKGDKWECIRTDIHKNYKYNLFAGEKYQAPEYSWLLMGSEYKTLFIDEVFSIVEYQDEGISKNNIKHRVNSAESACRFYELAMKKSKSSKKKLTSYLNLKRFEAHSKNKSGFHFIGYTLASLDRLRIRFLM